MNLKESPEILETSTSRRKFLGGGILALAAGISARNVLKAESPTAPNAYPDPKDEPNEAREQMSVKEFIYAFDEIFDEGMSIMPATYRSLNQMGQVNFPAKTGAKVSMIVYQAQFGKTRLVTITNDNDRDIFSPHVSIRFYKFPAERAPEFSRFAMIFTEENICRDEKRKPTSRELFSLAKDLREDFDRVKERFPRPDINRHDFRA